MTTRQDIEQQLILLLAQAKTIGLELVSGLMTAEASAIAGTLNDDDNIFSELVLIVDDAKNYLADKLRNLDGEQFEVLIVVTRL